MVLFLQKNLIEQLEIYLNELFSKKMILIGLMYYLN